MTSRLAPESKVQSSPAFLAAIFFCNYGRESKGKSLEEIQKIRRPR